MGLVRGDNAIVYVDEGGSTDQKVIGCFRSATLSFDSEMLETSITGQGSSATFIPAKQSFSISLEGLLYIDKEGLKYTTFNFLQAQQNETLLSVEFVYTDEQGNFMSIAGNGYVENDSITNSFDNVATFSVNIRGTGSLNIQTGS